MTYIKTYIDQLRPSSLRVHDKKSSCFRAGHAGDSFSGRLKASGCSGEQALVLYQYEGLNLANQKRRKLGVFGRNLEESHSPFIYFF